ncbi:MAG: helix-turn-helix domain-containing protein [Gemmatimonadota bacterium]|nr:helix-turn-helix domain-containing protein [Gemmatimonadota bacterium]
MSRTPVSSTLRKERRRAGLSQAALAHRVGVSRQAIVAIEAGKQVPGTDLALNLARALSCSVEDLFHLETQPSTVHATMAEAGEPSSKRVVLGRVLGRWVAHPVSSHTQAAHGVTGSGSGSGGRIEPLTAARHFEDNLLVAGCAPLLGLLAQRSRSPRGDLAASWIPRGSVGALGLLDAGLVHMAGVHFEDSGPGALDDLIRSHLAGQPWQTVTLTRWRQGLAVPKGNPLAVRTPEDLLRPGLRFAHRERGAVAHQLLTRFVEGAGGRPEDITGPTASGHLAVAHAVAMGAADTGITIEAAALSRGLDFVPLSEERFDLVLRPQQATEKTTEAFLNLMVDGAFRRDAGALGGYDLSQTGRRRDFEPAPAA